MSELRTEGACVLLTTHSMDEAERLADDVVIIDGGAVIAAGSPTELTGGGKRELSFDGPVDLDIGGLAAALPAGCTVARPRAGHVLISGAVDPATVAAVTSWCADRGVLADNLHVRARSLEDVFLELTGRGLRS